jgi:putative transcriptional regulator
MTIEHHPRDETLAAFAGGTLDEARALIVATHVSLCPRCRRAVAAFEAVGGEMLNALDPAPLSPDALDHALARIETPAELAAVRTPRDNDATRLPSALSGYELGPWRRVWHGIQLRTVDVPSVDGMRVFMLRAPAGTRLPRHRHQGDEWTCVLEGSFTHARGHYGPGDMDEADEAIEHHPLVGAEGPCVCIVALERGIVFQSWLGRLVQPLVRM